MLLILIPTLWIALLGFVVVLCQSAAAGDAGPGPVNDAPVALPGGIRVWRTAGESSRPASAQRHTRPRVSGRLGSRAHLVR